MRSCRYTSYTCDLAAHIIGKFSWFSVSYLGLPCVLEVYLHYSKVAFVLFEQYEFI